VQTAKDDAGTAQSSRTVELLSHPHFNLRANSGKVKLLVIHVSLF
jgi:hypothetical protein